MYTQPYTQVDYLCTYVSMIYMYTNLFINAFDECPFLIKSIFLHKIFFKVCYALCPLYPLSTLYTFEFIAQPQAVILVNSSPLYRS